MKLKRIPAEHSFTHFIQIFPTKAVMHSAYRPRSHPHSGVLLESIHYDYNDVGKQYAYELVKSKYEAYLFVLERVVNYTLSLNVWAYGEHIVPKISVRVFQYRATGNASVKILTSLPYETLFDIPIYEFTALKNLSNVELIEALTNFAEEAAEKTHE